MRLEWERERERDRKRERGVCNICFPSFHTLFAGDNKHMLKKGYGKVVYEVLRGKWINFGKIKY